MMRRFSRWTLELMGMLGLLIAAFPASAMTFSDATFADSSWTQTILIQLGSAQTPTSVQQLTGGNPGAWREMTHPFGSGAGSLDLYHEYTGGSFDPSTLAADQVLLLDYSEDQIELNPPFANAAIGAAPALRQDGVVYTGPKINFTTTSWVTRTLPGLSAWDFTEFGGTAHPDFTASGTPITFGYYRYNSTTGTSFTTTHGIDNWSFATSTTTIGTIASGTKISDTTGGFGGTLLSTDDFGQCVAYLGDIDGDGVGDLATSTRDDTAATDAGAVWVLRMNSDDTVKAETKIAAGGVGGFIAKGNTSDRLGQCVEGIGDLNYDGVPDLAAGTEAAGDGAVWILFLNADGTVRSEKRIGDGDGGFPAGLLSAGDALGRDLARVGDLDGDGVVDLAVGAPGFDDDGTDRGAVFVLFLEPDGWVKGYTQISDSTVPGLGLLDGDTFGLGVTGLGDLDGDGVPDLAVGAWHDDDAGTDAGAVYVLLLNSDGSVKAHQKLGSAAVGGGLQAGDRFGIGVAGLGDLDGDGVPDLAAGASNDDDGGSAFGAAYVILLNPDGSAKGFQKISHDFGNFTFPLNTGDSLGVSVEGYAGVDGVPRLVAGAMQDDDGGTNHGALYVLKLAGAGQSPVCGNFLREGTEECDDGNTNSGDTCSTSCEVEDVLFLRGTASGGHVDVTVSGEPVQVTTSSGHAAQQVLAALASAINADATLQGLGVTATSRGEALYTTGSITASSSSDGGLVLGERDDLVLEGSHLELEFPLFGFGDDPSHTLFDQNAASVALTVTQNGGFTLPGGLLTGSGVGHASIACAAGSGTLLSGVHIHIAGPAGVRCTGGLSGQRSVLFHYTSPYGVTGTGIGAYDLQPVGLGGTWLTKTNSTYSDAAYGRVDGLPWTAGTGVAMDYSFTGTNFFTIHSTFSGTTVLPIPTGTSIPTTRRGVEARRADGIGAFNPVTPIAFRSLAYFFGAPVSGSDARFAQLHLRFVPEPALWLGLAAGGLLLPLLWARRRRSRAAKEER